jgi:hypothetical protein
MIAPESGGILACQSRAIRLSECLKKGRHLYRAIADLTQLAQLLDASKRCDRTLRKIKSRREQVLPLPESTGQAIANYWTMRPRLLCDLYAEKRMTLSKITQTTMISTSKVVTCQWNWLLLLARELISLSITKHR